MATKPTIANARWAETAGGSPSAGMSSPSSGKRDTGWAVEKPTYQNMNYLLHEFYLWAKYVSDQIFAGAVDVIGALTAGTVQSDGDLFHTGDRARSLHASAFSWRHNYGGTSFWDYSPVTSGAFEGAHITCLSTGSPAHADLSPDVNDVLGVVAVFAECTSGTVTARLCYDTHTTGVQTVVASATSSGTSRQSIVLGLALNHRVEVGRSYYIEVEASAGGGVCAVYDVATTYQHMPPP